MYHALRALELTGARLMALVWRAYDLYWWPRICRKRER